ncbi:hypothetical protein OAP67_00650 [Candidatus Pelagibacter sp.]|nr:hypothetical protein [Candidatus Pelagibacter sp.]
MLEINFNQLIKNYNADILTKTRSFNTDQEHLKFWVPSEDIIESVINLIDSLKESKELNFLIIFSKKIFDKEKIEELNLIFNNFSSYKCLEKDNDYFYTFEIDQDKLNDFFKNKTKPDIIKNIKNNKFNEVKFVPEIFEKEPIKEYYIKEIKNFDFNKFKNFFENKINLTDEKKDSFEIFSSDVFDYQLTLKLSVPGLFICDFSFKKKNSNNLNWVDSFFQIVKKTVENKPLREIKDHGMIYLVDMLRPKRNVPEGIIHPDNEGKIFYDLKLFFKSAYKSLAKDNKDLNRYYKKLSPNWRKLGEDKKIEIINKELVDFCYENDFSKNLNDLSVKRIENNFKVILNVSPNFSAKQKKKNFLLHIEEIFKKNVDFRLEVFITMMIDDGKLRKGKSFKNNKYLKLD